MKTKYFIISTATAFLISNVLTTLWYMMMDGPNYVPFRREEINYGMLMLNHLLYAGLMVYFYPFFYAKKPSLFEAFTFGALISALMFIPQALVIRSIWTVDINMIFVLNTIAHLIIGGLMAIMIYFILRKRLMNA
ncbi:hypothetical protein FNH22_06955 [Fulvivirga sp. M361]|uniref:hypothetical protein n=1 Tax=Fulvivirga sp. M361 TaxID=2594266 RepID=UPI00117AF5C7|nr:hypothetical protein [Fulvivirga sp. M361]TRX60774.1 hypothetical protein FNH22_06955 [Fulvivirga sp. M361]